VRRSAGLMRRLHDAPQTGHLLGLLACNDGISRPFLLAFHLSDMTTYILRCESLLAEKRTEGLEGLQKGRLISQKPEDNRVGPRRF